jgi:hypothetical protein
MNKILNRQDAKTAEIFHVWIALLGDLGALAV